MGKGDSPKVTPASTLEPIQKDIMSAIGGLALPEIGRPGPSFPGQRLAEIDPFFTGAGRGAISNLGGSLEEFAQPALDLFRTQITPQVMERFAAFGGAGGGGAQQALGRTGAQTIMSQAFNPWIQAQMGLPGLSQQAGLFERQARQEPLDVEQQKFLEQQPFASPFIRLGQSLLPGSGVFRENIVQPAQQGFGQSLLTGLAGAIPFI
jgi:hypothetical protein